MTQQRTRGPLIEGFIGSLLILIGSFGVGWLVSTSPIARYDWVIRLRTEVDGVVVSTALLTLGCWVLFRAWLRLGRRLGEGTDTEGWSQASLRPVNLAIVLWTIPQLIVIPIFSRDVFAYLNQGRLVLTGQDPYQTGVSALDNWFQLGTDPIWAQDATPYGPLFLWIEAAVMWATGSNNDLAIFAFRLSCVAGVVLMMIFVPKLARMHSVHGARAQWLATANPLLIISFISSVHNDAIMVGFALAGIWAASHGRGVLATVLVVVSIGIKPITMVLLPFIALLWAGPGSSWPRKFTFWFITAGIAGLLMITIGMVQGYGFGWLTVLIGTGTGATFWSPIAIFDGILSGLLANLGLTHYWTLDTFRLIGRLASVVIVIVLMFVGPDTKIVRRMMWAFTAVVVLSPVIQPWYLLWLLPLFAVTGIRPNWQFKWVAFTVAFFLAFGASDQLSIYPFLDIEPAMILLSLGISYACLAVMATVDPGTRWVVWRGWELPPVKLNIPWKKPDPQPKPPAGDPHG